MRSTLSCALGAVVVVTGCAATSDSHQERIGSTRQEIRGVDPGTLRAPAYVVTIDSIKVDRAASMPREVLRYGSYPGFNHVYAAADKVRVGLDAQVQTTDGHVGYPVPAFDCQIGERFDGGLLGPLEYTREGSTYTRCLGNPFRPTLADAPLRLDAIPVHDTDTLNVFTSLEVLDPADAWLSGSGTDRSPRQTLMDIGAVASTAGAIVSAIPPAAAVGAVIAAVGAVFSFAGYVVPPSIDPITTCSVSPSLVPGWGTGMTPSDAISPVLRTSLTGRQLYEATVNGDALVAYDLDFGPDPGTHRMCQRPRTEVVLRIRRVPMENEAATYARARSSNIIAPEPSEIDAFAITSANAFEHDGRGYDDAAPLAFEAQGDLSALHYVVPNPYVLPNPCASSLTLGGKIGSSLPSSSGTTGKGGGCWLPLFPRKANVAAITRRPNEIDVYAIDVDGDIEWTTRDMSSSAPAWSAWHKVTTGGWFPPGAPLSAASSATHTVDVYAVARDGSVQRLFMYDGYTAGPFTHVVAGKVRPFDGTSGGGVVAVSMPSSEGLYAIGYDGHVLSAWGNPWSSSWSYLEGFAAPSFQATPGAALAGVSRDANRLDLFVVDTYGLVRTTGWYGAWQPTSTAITPSTLPAPPGAPLAVVSRKVDVALSTDAGFELTNNEQMDVFVTGNDGHIVDAHWRFGDNSYSWNPADAHALSTVAAPNGAIGAVAPNAGSIFVAAARADGTLAKTWFEDLELSGPHWQSSP
ncbi:MAG: hypothetical protein ACXVEE_03745 [Polyangiales bacterium]